MAQYRKKPVVINAWPVSDILNLAKNHWATLPNEFIVAYEKGDFVLTPESIHVKTLEGVHITGKDDMLIQGVKGEFYGCKMDIFEATYEAVE